ncbi:Cold-shock DNA-binding domain protein [Rubripirellula obstinata]|uniref:Cold-shock DNA-binding domain protein n=1 Tax=Rubripirellula obstinata TaxID=406547 RepID=A0A5B1CLW6_9BACT|nr:cold shock domain-containing protein [Rubripirellula obstinata]KAA1260779.1 Cold-shock DNA-binding domain protein [Rubripirellula obstinata]
MEDKKKKAVGKRDPRQELTREAEVRRRFPIERRRLGQITSFLPDSNFGFIDGEDFREDVFFHMNVWQSKVIRDGREVRIEPEEGLWVEFEIDDNRFEDEKKLRAKSVRPTDRPGGRKLSGRDATFKIVTHHPRARRKRPTWRDSD